MKSHFTSCVLKLLTLLVCVLALNTNVNTQSQQYLHFDRIDDFVEIPAASQYIANGSGLTMTGWFWCDELAYGQGMFGFRNGGTGDGESYMIQLNNGVLENRYITSGGFTEYVAPAFTVLPEQWQHYAWIWDGSFVYLYLNGNLVGSTGSSSTPISSMDTPFGIGQLISPFNFYFGGRIDEVSVWNRAISKEEIDNMIANELIGDEDGLQLYYKFNQGIPNGDNTSISKLICEVGNGERDGSLENFALNGEISNFGGELDTSFQAISFPKILDKLTTDSPFNLEAIASSGLDVSYTIVSGPASVSGNTVTLDGTVGEVVVRASQSGDSTYEPAVDVELSFNVLDPETFTPVIDLRAPLANTEVIVSTLGPVQLAAIVNIGSPELFNVQTVEFEIDGEKILAEDWNNDHYTAWWTPSDYGSVTMNVIATNNYGANTTMTVEFDVVSTLLASSSNVSNDLHLDVNIGEAIVTAELPTFVGAYDEIIANLDIGCPSGGCDPWDRVSGVEVKGHNGEWYEIIRYITPYGIACNHAVDLTDFRSLLYGKVDFRFTLGTQGNGFLYTLDLDYMDGVPDYAYSHIDKLWNDTYVFGNMDELQPSGSKLINFNAEAKAAKIKLVATGHGWGDNNTANAAEFSNNTHHILINGDASFTHNNWLDCDPNPDGCNDQLGTWFFNRAGWCPGAIAPWNDFDMTSYLTTSDIEVQYRLQESYVDLCNASNPDCISGVTCPNCNDGFNPHLITASFLITEGDNPFGINSTVGLNDQKEVLTFSVFPNPTSSSFELRFDPAMEISEIGILNGIGQNIMKVSVSKEGIQSVDVSNLNAGLYFIELKSAQGSGVEQLIVR